MTNIPHMTALSPAFKKHVWNPDEIFEIRNTPSENLHQIIQNLVKLQETMSGDVSVTESDSELYSHYQLKSSQYRKVMIELKRIKKAQIDLTSKVSSLQSELAGLTDWVKEPILSALLEMSFKTSMSALKDSNYFSFSEILNQANPEAVLRNTDISLDDWKMVKNFLNGGPYGRNSKLHGSFPRRSIAYACYVRLIEKLGQRIPLTVSRILLKLIEELPE